MYNDMNLVKRDVTGQVRACNECGETKYLETGFRYSKRYDCYQRTCSDCVSRKERVKRQSVPVPDKPVDIGSRKCLGCEQEKPINQFHFHKGSGYYLNYCRGCKNEERRKEYAGLTPDRKIEKLQKARSSYRSMVDKTAIVYQHCTQYDKKRNLECDLDIEYVRDSLQKPCTYCGYPSTGLDRKVNGIGHTKENCLPSCRDCNVARSNHFSVEEMKLIGATIAEVKRRRLERNEGIFREHRHKGE